MKIRQMRKREVLPIKTGMEPLELDHEWVWVAEDDRTGVVVGVLILAPCHGSIFVVRVVAGPDAPVTWLRRILTHAGRAVLERGYKVAFTYFNLDRPNEMRLAKLMMGHGVPERRGAVIANQAMCVQSVEDWI